MTPLLIGAANCTQATGLSWAHLRRLARRLGIAEIQVGVRKRVLPAAPLLAALEAQRAQSDDGLDELAAMRARVARAGAR